MATRDDFSSPVKDAAAKRVGYRCSRGSCRKGTVGAHTNPAKSTLVGVAAHICAAAAGGPRYDPSQSSNERGGIENAVWLCPSCATEIDKDPERFPVRLLRQWKEEAEFEATADLSRPSARLGIPSPVFEPPLEYQLDALRQVLEHLKRSGVAQMTLAQLDVSIRAADLRDGINPSFEPLSVASVRGAIDQLLLSQKLRIEGSGLLLTDS